MPYNSIERKIELFLAYAELWSQLVNGDNDVPHPEELREQLDEAISAQALAIAEQIYTTIFGDLDNRHFRAAKVAEMHDWLIEGDPETLTGQTLVAGWRAYDPDAPEPEQ